jgi:hypothetical protein
MIIGLTGLAGSGKSTVAMILEDEFGYERIPFAEPIKKMARAFGLSHQEMSTDKEKPSELLCGRSPRQFMQWLGTDLGRNMIGKDVWTRAWKRSVDNIEIDTFGPLLIVADDVRFPDEAEMIRSMGGKIIRVLRDGAGSTSGAEHESERHFIEYDLAIWNDGDIHELTVKVQQAIRVLER